MSRIRWYGPTLVLILTVLVVMVAGPRLTRNLTYTQKAAEIQLIQQSLEHSDALAQLSSAFRNVGKVVEPSVVHIQVSQQARNVRQHGEGSPFEFFFPPNMLPEQFRDRFRQQQEREEQPDREDLDKYNPTIPMGAGSGWVFDNAGHIVTNNHVVTLRDGDTVADEIKVKFHDGSERMAKVVGRDPKTDIAVLKVEGPVIPAKAARELVQQGDIVFAFGSPLQFQFSMSQGIVSATERNGVGILADRGGYENFIQTDAAINPGNSGGPLTNIYGEVVGMNTAIASRTGLFSGIGLAIPVQDVVYVVNQLLDNGKVTRGFLGIGISDLDAGMAQTFGYTGKGVLVDQLVPDSPAANADIKPGDIIISIDGQRFANAATLRNSVSRIRPGEKVEVVLFRDGKEHKTQVTIGVLPDRVAMGAPQGGDEPAEQADPAQADYEMLSKLGLEQLETLTPELAQRARIDFQPGVLVASVRRGSSAFAAGIPRGAIITEVMGQEVKSVQNLIDELKQHDLTKPVRVRVIIRGSGSFRLLQLPAE